MNMNICVVGLGYVGLALASAFADWGNQVSCFDQDQARIDQIQQGLVPFFEPCLEESLARNLLAGRMRCYASLPEALDGADIIFLSVQTPTDKKGQADLSWLFAAAKDVGASISKDAIIVIKSTAPPGTARKVQRLFDTCPNNTPVVVSPEFLREGSALDDLINPMRIVIGAQNIEARKGVAMIYQNIDTEILETDWESAELIKYASNAFLATKISFANALARLCESTGANIELVATGMGLDTRIGHDFLRAGLGYGGSCFPKDVQAMVTWAKDQGYDFKLLRAVQEINDSQVYFVLDKVRKAVGGSLAGKRLALLGLSFKPQTDDVRESPALKLADLLHKAGSALNGYDPHALHNVAKAAPYIKACSSVVEACNEADAVLLLTDWIEFARLPLSDLGKLVRNKVLLDARNLFVPDAVGRCGWKYDSIGRP